LNDVVAVLFVHDVLAVVTFSLEELESGSEGNFWCGRESDQGGGAISFGSSKSTFPFVERKIFFYGLNWPNPLLS